MLRHLIIYRLLIIAKGLEKATLRTLNEIQHSFQGMGVFVNCQRDNKLHVVPSQPQAQTKHLRALGRENNNVTYAHFGTHDLGSKMMHHIAHNLASLSGKKSATLRPLLMHMVLVP